MPTLAVNGVELYYEVHGSGPPVLGIHGTPSSALLWEDAAEVLGRRSRCIIYDRRGFTEANGPNRSKPSTSPITSRTRPRCWRLCPRPRLW